MAHRPASQLEQLHGLRRRLHPRHQFGQRDDLLVYPEHLKSTNPRTEKDRYGRLLFSRKKRAVGKPRGREAREKPLRRERSSARVTEASFSHPGFYVGVMIVADVVDREHRAVFLRVPALRPEAGEIRRALRRHAQHHHRCTLVVVNQGPEFAARVSKGPFRHDVFPRLRVSLRRAREVDKCSHKELGNDRQIDRAGLQYHIYRSAAEGKRESGGERRSTFHVRDVCRSSDRNDR